VARHGRDRGSGSGNEFSAGGDHRGWILVEIGKTDAGTA
jgi:hypothetical protein